MFGYLVLVEKVYCVCRDNPCIIYLGEASPFVAETLGPYFPVAALEDGIHGFFFYHIWSVDMVDMWEEKLFSQYFLCG